MPTALVLRLETIVLPGHRLEVADRELPEGAKVEVIVRILEQSGRTVPASERENTRAAALDQFLAFARISTFYSAGPYPTRDELHERP